MVYSILKPKSVLFQLVSGLQRRHFTHSTVTVMKKQEKGKLVYGQRWEQPARFPNSNLAMRWRNFLMPIWFAFLGAPKKKHGVSCPSCLWRFMFEQCRSICISTCPPCSGLQLATNTINFNARSPSCGTSCESHCYCPSDVAEEFHVHTYPNV